MIVSCFRLTVLCDSLCERRIVMRFIIKVVHVPVTYVVDTPEMPRTRTAVDCIPIDMDARRTRRYTTLGLKYPEVNPKLVNIIIIRNSAVKIFVTVCGQTLSE